MARLQCRKQNKNREHNNKKRPLAYPMTYNDVMGYATSSFQTSFDNAAI